MRIFAFAFVVVLAFGLSHGRNLSLIRKDAFTVGTSKSDSASEYDFISEMTLKMKVSRFRLVSFENAAAGQKLLLDGKIDAIIAKINHSPQLADRFLVSEPYGKSDIAVASLVGNNKIWTLSDLNGKVLAFIPKDISKEQVSGIWKDAKLNAAQSLTDALDILRRGEADAVVADRQILESQKDSQLRIFPNKLHENNVVALFAPGSKDLQEEFNRALREREAKDKESKDKPADGKNPASSKERISKIVNMLDELKRELLILQKEMK